jgi:hypothetical protein
VTLFTLIILRASSAQFAQGLNDFIGAREPAFAILREYQSAIGDNVEDADRARGELGLHPELFRDFGRQTGSLRQIVSAAAVSDGDAHGRIPDSTSEVYVNRRAGGS